MTQNKGNKRRNLEWETPENERITNFILVHFTNSYQFNNLYFVYSYFTNKDLIVPSKDERRICKIVVPK